jgi:hypothetical protein
LIILPLIFLHELKTVALPVVFSREEPAGVDAEASDDRRECIEAWMVRRVLDDVPQLFLLNTKLARSRSDITAEATMYQALHASGESRRVNLRHTVP